MYYVAIALIVGFSLWTVGSYVVVRNLEEPAYTVVEKRSGYEIREYAPYITAETDISGTYEEALNGGFSLIADYIFGNNTTQTSISMTAPVLESTSETIAMTVPVATTIAEDKARTVSFVLPAKYTLESLPVPNNPKVVLREVPARTVAALGFSWYATEDRVAKKKVQLEAALAADGLVVAGATQVAQYNPPFSMPLTRRNEILVPIRPQ